VPKVGVEKTGQILDGGVWGLARASYVEVLSDRVPLAVIPKAAAECDQYAPVWP